MENNYPLNFIAQRYGVPENSRTPYQELQFLNVNVDFISTVVKLFDDAYPLSEGEFQKFSLNVIIDYIRKTHDFYLTKKLPEIEQSITLLLADYEGNHPLLFLLKEFFISYQKDLRQHIETEEKQLLPYIEYLSCSHKGNIDMAEFFCRTKEFSVQKFIDDHSDVEGDLEKVRNLILLYDPPKSNQTPYRILLTQLEFLENDLRVHAIIEDQVLLPKALLIESKLERIFKKKIMEN